MAPAPARIPSTTSQARSTEMSRCFPTSRRVSVGFAAGPPGGRGGKDAKTSLPEAPHAKNSVSEWGTAGSRRGTPARRSPLFPTTRAICRPGLNPVGRVAVGTVVCRSRTGRPGQYLSTTCRRSSACSDGLVRAQQSTGRHLPDAGRSGNERFAMFAIGRG